MNIAVPQAESISKAGRAFKSFHHENGRKLVALLRKAPLVLEVVQKWQESGGGKNFRVIIPPDLSRQVDARSARLGRATTGLLTANIHDNRTGRIIGQVSLKEIPPHELYDCLGQLNQMAVLSTLAEVVDRLETIEQKIDAVSRQQMDSLVGLVDSGEDLYCSAARATDPDNRKLLLASSVAQLSEARGRLIRSLETEIKWVNVLPDSKWRIVVASLKRNIPRAVESKAEHLEFLLRHAVRASSILAFSYGQMGEDDLLRASWDPLGRFLPQLRGARERVIRWLPDRPRLALPDKLSTLLSLAERLVQTGEELNSGRVETIEVPFSASEITEGEIA